MSEATSSSIISLPLLPITNFWKGGDFMEREQTTEEQQLAEELYALEQTAIGEIQVPDPAHEDMIRRMYRQSRTTLLNQRDDEGNNDRFPERVMVEAPDPNLVLGNVQQVKP